MSDNTGDNCKPLIADNLLNRSPGGLSHSTSLGTKTPSVLFCNGFLSSMEGQKSLAVDEYCRASGRSCTRFDYHGHCASSGNFIDFTLSDWIHDTMYVLDNITKGPVIVVGSSMGAWIALHVALARPERVAGIVGVASASDFLAHAHDNMSAETKLELEQNGITYLPSRYSDEPYPITKKLVEDSRRWNFFTKQSIPIKCPVRLIHGLQDLDIPWQKSLELARLLESDNIEVTLIKNGDHRLSKPNELKRLTSIISELTLEFEQSLL